MRRKKRKSDRSKRHAKKSQFGRAGSLSGQSEAVEVSISVLDKVQKDKQLRRKHNVSNDEMEILLWMAKFGCDLGQVRSLRDLIYILNTIRHASKR